MGNSKSYTITFSNIKSEKEAIKYLLESDQNFLNPDRESRKLIMKLLHIEKRYSRAFDLIKIPGYTNLEEIVRLESAKDIMFIELKTTKKYLSDIPRGFFFGATENEFNLAKQLKDQFQFCFVSLHPDSLGYSLLTLVELEKIIKTKRIQYQINLMK